MNGFSTSPATLFGRELIKLNQKMHYDWIRAAGPSIDAQISKPAQRYLCQRRKKKGWQPSLEQRYSQQVRDKRLSELVRDCKPGVSTQLPEHVVRYKEYREKNRKVGLDSLSIVEKYEYQKHRSVLAHVLRNAKPITDTGPPGLEKASHDAHMLAGQLKL